MRNLGLYEASTPGHRLAKAATKARLIVSQQYWDAEDIAAFAGVVPSVVSNWQTRYGNFPAPVLVGGRKSWRRADIVAWLESRG